LFSFRPAEAKNFRRSSWLMAMFLFWSLMPLPATPMKKEEIDND
jgi:hypothetical protein